MNKTQLVKAVAERTGSTIEVAGQAVNAFFDVVADKVAEGEKVAIVGFGSWERVQRPARGGRNPATGQTIPVPATFVPKFKVGAEFRGKVRGKAGV